MATSDNSRMRQIPTWAKPLCLQFYQISQENDPQILLLISSEAKNWVISDVDFEKNKKLFAALSPVNGLADKNKAQQVRKFFRIRCTCIREASACGARGQCQ